jgi:hypothetical protein
MREFLIFIGCVFVSAAAILGTAAIVLYASPAIQAGAIICAGSIFIGWILYQFVRQH